MPSTRRSPKTPDRFPELFPLGGVRPRSRTEQTLDDDVWIVEQSEAGRVLLTRDHLRLGRHREAIPTSAARIFRIGDGARTAELQITWIRTNAHRIVRRSRRDGPFIDVVREKTVERDWPKTGRR